MTVSSYEPNIAVPQFIELMKEGTVTADLPPAPATIIHHAVPAMTTAVLHHIFLHVVIGLQPFVGLAHGRNRGSQRHRSFLHFLLMDYLTMPGKQHRKGYAHQQRK